LGSSRSMTVFDVLTEYVVFASSIFYLLAVIGMMMLRRRQPLAPRPYRTFGYPVVPLVYVAFYVWFLFEVYRSAPAHANIGLGLIALGIPVYFWWQRRAAPPQAAEAVE
jgi:APA family basic amino acid/polyamine antiporter